VANNDGVFLIDGHRSQLIRSSERTSFSMMVSERYPGRVYVGLSNGLAVLERTDEGWQDRGRVHGVREQVRTMFELPDGSVWLGTAHSGAGRLVLTDRPQRDPVTGQLVPEHLVYFGLEAGLPHLDRNFVYRIAGEPIFSTQDGFMRFEEEAGRFEPDPRFASLFPGSSRRLTAVEQGVDGRIWMHARDDGTGMQETGAAILDDGGEYRWEAGRLHKLRGIYTYSVQADEDGILWFGGDEGLFRYDPAVADEPVWPFSAMIRRVEVEGGRLLFGGHGTPETPVLEFAENNIRFELAAPSFVAREQLEFQIMLEGRDRDWMHWRSEAFERRGNLWEGQYRMRVRARDARGQISDEATFSFEVLPPWYRTAWAYLFYVVALVIFGLLALNLYHRRLAAQNRFLHREVRERTSDLEQARDRAEQALERLQSTQAELVEAERMATVGRLVSGMAHEVNTPVSNGRMAATRLDAGRDAFMQEFESADGRITRSGLRRFLDDCRQGLELMSTSFDRIGTLVGRLHRIAGEPQGARSEPYDLCELLEDVVGFRREEARRQGVEIRYECRSGLMMTGNRLTLSECLNELISNSLMHGFPEDIETGGEQRVIAIEASQSGDLVLIVYRDNGLGLDLAVEARIFEPFAAGMQSDARHPGLGMHMLFQMVKRVLGGEIRSRPSRQGVHFEIELPVGRTVHESQRGDSDEPS
jgi:signal transduction histidine kinase